MYCVDLTILEESGQEPRLICEYSGDQSMLKAYKEGKDLYAVIAASMYNNKYEDNLEYYPEGTEIEFNKNKVICGNKTHLNKSGKARRFEAKSVLIGILYGRGAASIAEQINDNRGDPKNICTKNEAQEIVNKFFKAYPAVKNWITETQEGARKYGYVEDWYGRRRRLPDINLPRYDIKPLTKKVEINFNPLVGCENRRDDAIIDKYTNILLKIRSKKEFEEVQKRARIEGLEIHDNSGFISQAERQSVNARVQGGAATLTKLAMINIDNDEELKSLDFNLSITVHDEVLGECPEENADRVMELLPKIMVDTANKYFKVPMSCDPYVEKCWYLSEWTNAVENEYKKLCSKVTAEEALETLLKNHVEAPEEDVMQIVNNILNKNN